MIDKADLIKIALTISATCGAVEGTEGTTRARPEPHFVIAHTLCDT